MIKYSFYYKTKKYINMLEKIILLLNSDDWYSGDEWVQIAKGRYAYPKNFNDIKDKAIRIIKTDNGKRRKN